MVEDSTNLNCPEAGDGRADKEMSALVSVLAGKYTIKRKLGEGWLARVYLAEDTALECEVAIKILSREFSGDREFVERFAHEARLCAKLEHPNIVRISQTGAIENTVYFIMNYIRGGTLTGQIKSKGIVPLDDCLRWADDICSALQYAHSKGIIHRDLKPNNIMIDGNGRAVVMDFGITRAAFGAGITKKNQIVGSPAYISPEMAAGDEIDIRSDIYSLGIVLYQMVTGTLPFDSQDIPSLLYLHVNQLPDPPDIRNTTVPDWLCGIIMKCLAKKPADRYNNSAELSRAIEMHSAYVAPPEEMRKTVKRSANGMEITDVLAKIPLFKGLTLSQLRSMIRLCKMQRLSVGDVLCFEGEESFKMFILVSGRLTVALPSGEIFSSVTPLGIAGEMGVFSGDRRSATVAAAEPGIVLTLHKSELFKLFHEEPELGISVHRNVIEDLAGKIRENHVIIGALKKHCPNVEYNRIIQSVNRT